MSDEKQASKLIIWRLLDGKVGHEKQSQALIEGLDEQLNIEVADVYLQKSWPFYLISCLFKLNPFPANTNQKPDIVVGTGHRTHLPLLGLKRFYRCKAICIMSPSLPTSLFDVVIAPRHDHLHKLPAQNVVLTPTALASKIESKPIEKKGLILLGGESKHYEWDNSKIIDCLEHILSSSNKGICWAVASSRRTPESTLQIIRERYSTHNNLKLFPYQELPENWLSDSLKTAGHIWVTADSASMLAEALMTKACIHLIQLKPKDPNGKLNISNSYLIEQGFLDDNKNSSDKKRKSVNFRDIIQKTLDLLEL